MSEEVRRVEAELERVSFEVLRFDNREIARLLDRGEAARILKISADGVDRLVADRELACVRLRHSVRFRPEDILDCIARNRGYGA
jgi:excisionase family DNA binding protein